MDTPHLPDEEPEHLLPLWKSLVLSKMEYLFQLWSLHRIYDIKRLEQAQRVFTRELNSMKNLSYWDRLRTLQLYSLQR